MRNLTADMVAEFSGSYLKPVIMLEAEFDNDTLRMWTGIGELEWGEKTFIGAGNFIGISPIDETQDLVAKGIVASLTGIPSSIIALALGERCRGRPFRLYMAVVDTTRYVATEGGDGRVELEDGSGFVLLENNLIDSPYRLFAGLMDVMEFTDNGAYADIRLSVESNLIIGQRAKNMRYTNEEQKRIYPGDRGLENIPSLQDKEIVW